MRVTTRNNKDYVFCDWRRKWVRLTPEEWVRQHLLHHLVEEYGYPQSLIGVEVAITVGDAHKRCDAIVYARDMRPLMLIECKADSVALTQKVLDQAVTYNRKLNVPYLMLHNGPQTIVAHISDEIGVNYLNHIPEWSKL